MKNLIEVSDKVWSKTREDGIQSLQGKVKNEIRWPIYMKIKQPTFRILNIMFHNVWDEIDEKH